MTDVEFTTPPSTPGSPPAAATFAERRLQRAKSSGLSSVPSGGAASMSGALAATAGSAALGDMRGYEDSGLHSSQQSAGVLAILPAPIVCCLNKSCLCLTCRWNQSEVDGGLLAASQVQCISMLAYRVER